MKNKQTLRKIAGFQHQSWSSPNARHQAFSSLKHEFPYMGIAPCSASQLEFLLWTANDDLVAWEYLWKGPNSFEPDLVELWVGWANEPGLFIDVGGYTGLFTILACLSNPANQASYVEPLARIAERAAINFTLNEITDRVTLMNFAASNVAGSAKINFFRDPEFLGTGSSLYDKGIKSFGTAEVRTEPLDKHINSKPIAIKIDVEGHELHVLEGLTDTIDKHQPKILIESWDHSRVATEEYFRSRDYCFTSLSPKEKRVMNFYCIPRKKR